MRTAPSTPNVMKSDTDTIDELAATLLRYLATRPDACDTVDGICDWWIPRQRYLDSRASVRAALQLLESRGQIGARTTLDGQVLYGLHGPGAS